MHTKPSSSPVLRDYHPAQRLLVRDVIEGLRREPKQISPMYFYDERGSQLFDRICELPEYYLTRTETRILDDCGDEIAQSIGPNALLVEFGSGASQKTRLLLDRLPALAGYIPVDISRSHLLAAARSICAAYPGLDVLPVCADFTQPFSLPKSSRPHTRVAVFFPGSTIGNFDRPAAVNLLRVMRQIAAPGGALLIGADLVKDPAILERAYNDAAGVTAAFNLNLLRRLNREFGATFDLNGFRHSAVWVPETSRIEMHLISLRRQSVTLGDETIEFTAGERLVTEHCHKYTRESFASLAAEGGWSSRRVWTDKDQLFSVHYLEVS